MLDLALAFKPDNRRIRQMHETVSWSEYESNFNVTWSDHQTRVQDIMRRANVLGIIVHDYYVRQQDEGWQLAGMTIRVSATSQPAEDQRLFERLSTLYVYGLPNQSDGASPALILP